MDMKYVQKAFDTVAGANYARQDLSDIVTLTYMPKRPIINNMPVGRATNTTHYWDEQALSAPTGTTASYNQGNKPYNTTAKPIQRNNVTARFGRTAQVTDEMAAVWTGAGGYRLAEGEMERLITEAMELNTEIQMEGVLNELEFNAIQGVSANNSSVIGSEVSQFDGIDLVVTTSNGLGTGTASNAGGPGQIVNAGSAALSEAMVRTLAQLIRNQKGPWAPDTLLVSPHDKAIVNQWHQSQFVVNMVENLQGGFDVSQYNTGFSTVNVVTHDWLASGRAYLVNQKLNFKRADLIPLGTEPLARVSTTIERLINIVTTLETRAIATTTGAVSNLSTS